VSTLHITHSLDCVDSMILSSAAIRALLVTAAEVSGKLRQAEADRAQAFAPKDPAGEAPSNGRESEVV
jgi:hypothetical protein